LPNLDPHWVEMSARVADVVYRNLIRHPPVVSPWLSPGEAAKYLSLQPRGLEAYRRTGGGPKFERPAKKVVRYHVNDLDAWARGESAE